MKTLVVQIQPDRLPEPDYQDVRCRLEEFGRVSPRVVRHSTHKGEDEAWYTNVSYSTDDLPALWRDLGNAFLEGANESEAFAQASIITCEGPNGWDDYLLLHHFDAQEKLDVL